MKYGTLRAHLSVEVIHFVTSYLNRKVCGKNSTLLSFYMTMVLFAAAVKNKTKQNKRIQTS